MDKRPHHQIQRSRGKGSRLDLRGIKKLRELILELAVRGKLVPQDPNDEPASVLLEPVAAEKKRLIEEKNIKKQKPLSPVSDDEKPFTLPHRWQWTSPGHIAQINPGNNAADNVAASFVPMPLISTGHDGRHDQIHMQDLTWLACPAYPLPSTATSIMPL